LKKSAAKAEKLEARVKELEAELCKLKKSYDVVSAYAAHYTPDHKLEDKRKELNEAYE
jgi:cell division protein FtsB